MVIMEIMELSHSSSGIIMSQHSERLSSQRHDCFTLSGSDGQLIRAIFLSGHSRK